MKSFDDLVTDEEAAVYCRRQFPSEEDFLDGRDFVHIEVCRRLEQALKEKGARTVMNKSNIFQYVCKKKGCLLGALVPVRGRNYWIYQHYVTSYIDVDTGEVDEDGFPVLDIAPSIPDYVSHSSRPPLDRDPTLHAICVDDALYLAVDLYVLSCRHTSVTASTNFEKEKKQARTKKHRALYV